MILVSIICYLIVGLVITNVLFGKNLFKASNNKDKRFNFWLLLATLTLWPLWLVCMLIFAIYCLIDLIRE